MTSADAGHIDRGQGVLDELARHSETFRCCLDGWLRAHPNDKLEIMLRLTLDPEGKVASAEIDASRSALEDPVALGCVVAVARDGSFPASPVGKTTVVNYPLRAEAR